MERKMIISKRYYNIACFDINVFAEIEHFIMRSKHEIMLGSYSHPENFKIAIPEYFKKLLINHIMQSHTLYLENERALREGRNIKFCGIEVIDHYKDEIVIFDFMSMDFDKNNKVLDLNDLKVKRPSEINFIQK